MKSRLMSESSEKCRFCFRSIITSDSTLKIPITRSVQKQFISLTQTELRLSQIYSSFICASCHENLNFCTNFKNKITENQLKLYESFENFEEDPEYSDPGVKNEFENPEIKQEDLDQSSQEIEKFQFAMESKRDLEYSEFGDAASFDFPIFDVPAVSRKSRKKKLVDKDDSKKSSEAAMRKKESVLCSDCGQIFKRKSLRKHVERAHLNLRKNICDICGHQSYHKYQMRNHISIHSKEKNYICQECGKLFSNPALLSSHRNSMHLKSEERPHECRECNKQFKHKKDLKIHFRFSHLKEKRYFCDFAECGKTFNSRLHFNDHQLSHSGTPTFSCEDCQKMFFTEFKLKNHRTLHVRAFSCNLCDKRFPKEYKLKQHLRVHSGLRDFSCSYCDNKYFSKSHLNRHVQNFHIQLKLKCEIPGCQSNVFSKKESYKSHLLSHHRNIEENSLKELLAKIRDIRPAVEGEIYKMKPKQE